ncbi:MAG: HAD family hydrolase [Sphingobacteriaceae bacterium]
MPEIKNIIFDYGNVIFSIDFKLTQDAFTQLGIPNVQSFFSHRQHNTLFDKFEQGNISADEFRKGIRRISERPDLNDQQIDDAWNTLLIGIPQGNHDLLMEVKKHYRSFLLSNTNEIHYKWIMQYLQEQFGFNNGNQDLFEKDYYSHLLRMRKPNRNIFEHILKENKLNPAETLFIDDSPQHLKTASELGIQTYLMTAPDNIQELFKQNGVLKNQ